MRGARRRASGGIALALIWACGTPPLVDDSGAFRHRRTGWTVRPPAGPASGPEAWQRVPVEGSLLAYRRSGPAGPVWMSLSSRCGISLAEPRFLARHLRIDLPEHRVLEDGEVSLAGRSGWRQVLEVGEGEQRVQVETVTFAVDRCALDWTLSVREGRGYESARRDFEAWWRSWQPPAPGAEGGP